jgi:hypothetical protein
VAKVVSVIPKLGCPAAVVKILELVQLAFVVQLPAKKLGILKVGAAWADAAKNANAANSGAREIIIPRHKGFTRIRELGFPIDINPARTIIFLLGEVNQVF